MPIEGRFFLAGELQEILQVSKQRVSNLAREQEWTIVAPGLYFAEDVEPYLIGRNIDPTTLTVVDCEYPGGATPGERSEDFSRDYQEMMAVVEGDDEPPEDH